jgi:hypothetical protein
VSERKYVQRGYQDKDRKEKKPERPKEGRPPRQDQMGPRTPRMVGSVLRARCSNCGTVLLSGFDQNGQCPKCGLELHCCKQCRHFDTGARFECTQPIPDRIPKKDVGNDCTFFEFRYTVEKDTAPTSVAASPQAPLTNPSSAHDARKAFEDLFKK